MEGVIGSILLVILGLGTGVGGYAFISYKKGNSLGKKKEEMLEKVQKEAEKAKRDYLLEAKEESHRIKLETDKEVKEKKLELKQNEERLLQRESNMDKRDELYQKREKTLDEREEKLNVKLSDIQNEQVKIEQIKDEQLTILENVSKLSRDEAKEIVMERIKETMNNEIASYIKEREFEAKLETDKKAKDLLVGSMQKYASEISNEQTITVITLPSDEMKGRLIGREGRNIRTIEAITGVDLIIDDTPEAVVLSSFDPLRREIARVTIETLIKDGRIHPTRIEELYDKISKDMNDKIMEYGNNALFELGITKMDPKLVHLIGKLHFRTSYGQNVLSHAIEVANLSGIIAGELGENVLMAKRAGILHDIGKSIDHELEGNHVDIGVDIAKKYGEGEIVLNAIASHHGDTDATSIISVIVAISDALSASRPGARNDSLENYIKRLEQLEAIGNEFKGVDKTFAVQAGRELRVIVKPEEIDDLASFKIAREIKEKIESTMQYPGTIKITVVRETRAQEEAK